MHNPNWSEEKSKAVFGKCNNPNYHGHNCDLEVKVIGEIVVETGYVMDAKVLADLIKDKIINRFDHKNLNSDTEDFKELNPTAENIATVIYDLLRAEIKPTLDIKIKLYETQRNYVEYPY